MENKQAYMHVHVHVCHFSGHFPGTSGLAGCPFLCLTGPYCQLIPVGQ